MKLRHVNPIGLADVPLIRRQGEPLDEEGRGCLKPNEVFEVTEDQARQLLPQVGNYAPADDEAGALLARLLPEDEPASTDVAVTSVSAEVPGDGSEAALPPVAEQSADQRGSV